jgi:malonate decarboxylase beta subunit
MGKDEFDASDRALVYRVTGGKHKYIMGDCNLLVADTIAAFRQGLGKVLAMPYAKIDALRRIGSLEKVLTQLGTVAALVEISPHDSRDVWTYAGNAAADKLVDMKLDEFLKTVKRLEIAS